MFIRFDLEQKYLGLILIDIHMYEMYITYLCESKSKLLGIAISRWLNCFEVLFYFC